MRAPRRMSQLSAVPKVVNRINVCVQGHKQGDGQAGESCYSALTRGKLLLLLEMTKQLHSYQIDAEMLASVSKVFNLRFLGCKNTGYTGRESKLLTLVRGVGF
jgi:hypothetical protein